MNYKIICDESILLDFIDSLPKCVDHERYYFSLFARKKYSKDKKMKHIKSDKGQLSRKLATEDNIYYKIRQMECPVGYYFSGNYPIPQEALALYINPNPRCLNKATYQSLEKFAKIIGGTRGSFNGFNPQAEAISCVQKSISRKIWANFDIDTKEDNILDKVEGILLDKSCYKILETRGGYHIMVEFAKVPESVSKTWYKGMIAISDSHGDDMIPCPGTYQGGFVPHFIT